MKPFLKRITSLLTLFLFAFYGCKKDNNNTVPIVAVDLFIYVNNPSFINLNPVGGWVYVTGGVRGILIYRKSTTEFMAFDRDCTYQPADACATVEVDNTNIIATNVCCGSQFSIYDGSVLHGPAKFALKSYNTTFDGNVLHIYN